MENTHQLTAFTHTLLDRAVHPQTLDDAQLAHFLETANFNEMQAKAYFLGLVMAAHLFANEQQARAWSDALLKKIARNRAAKMPLAALLAAAPQIAGEATTEAMQVEVPPPEGTITAEWSAVYEQPQRAKKRMLPGPLNVQAAKQAVFAQRIQPQAAKTVETPQAARAPEAAQPQPQGEEVAQQRPQRQAPKVPAKKPKGLGIFGKTMIGAGIAAFGGAAFAGTTIFTVIT